MPKIRGKERGKGDALGRGRMWEEDVGCYEGQGGRRKHDKRLMMRCRDTVTGNHDGGKMEEDGKKRRWRGK